MKGSPGILVSVPVLRRVNLLLHLVQLLCLHHTQRLLDLSSRTHVFSRPFTWKPIQHRSLPRRVGTDGHASCPYLYDWLTTDYFLVGSAIFPE